MADPVIDTTGFDLFVEIGDQLQSGDTPSEASWNSLYSAPGYATIIDNEREEDMLRDLMQLSFHSDAGEDCKVPLGANDTPRPFLEHFARCKALDSDLALNGQVLRASLTQLLCRQ